MAYSARGCAKLWCAGDGWPGMPERVEFRTKFGRKLGSAKADLGSGCQSSSGVEHRFRKAGVVGSNPTFGFHQRLQSSQTSNEHGQTSLSVAPGLPLTSDGVGLIKKSQKSCLMSAAEIEAASMPVDWARIILPACILAAGWFLDTGKGGLRSFSVA